jgi:hypothetical protein
VENPVKSLRPEKEKGVIVECESLIGDKSSFADGLPDAKS